MPADPLPYRDPVHKGPASGACQLYDHLKPLSDFDNRDRVRNHGWNEHNQHCSFKKRIKRDQRKNLTDERTKAQRESIALSCIANSHASRESNPDRAYLDEQSWYTTCPAPVEGDSDYIASPASFANYSSPENESYLHLENIHSHNIVDTLARTFSFAASSSFATGSALASEKFIVGEAPPPEPPDNHVAPRDNLDFGPADSGCNLPVTNPRTVKHFGLTPQLWPTPRWIKFANNQRECSTHYADFGQIIGKVAILESAPDTLISVPVLCRKGFEVSFKIPGGVGIYLQGKLVHQGIVEKDSDMFYVNTKELLALSIKFQNPERFSHIVTSDPPIEPTTLCLGITADKIRQVLWLHKRLGHPSRHTMVQAIKNQTWIGIPPDDLTAADVNATFQRTACTACQLSKSNRLPRGEGSGIHPQFPVQDIVLTTKA